MIKGPRIAVLFCLLSLVPTLQGQFPKREFRGVWVATVANIDWPSESGLSSRAQQDEIVRILDLHQGNGINAVILQVRPTADAIYPSEFEPWSRFLSGTQGLPPDPYYDPLDFWVRECHRRGMELHAWFNPYRIGLDTGWQLSGGHTALLHPEWTFDYGGRKYYSPANPMVWEYTTEVILEVVRNYDIDAVHFDDYFYPYAVAGEDIPDSLEFMLFGGDYYPGQLEDWRRRNVDTIIHKISLAIKEEKPWVKFGISPFGVWRNRDADPRGSETRAGSSNYDGLYADVIRWMEEGWIDYLLPQLYWRDEHPVASFSTLAYWWNDHHFGRSVYVGLAPYRIDRKSSYRSWRREKHLLAQIEILRELEGMQGYAFFSSRHFERPELRKFNRTLEKKVHKYPALVPAMPWIDARAPDQPRQLQLDGRLLSWEADSADNELDRVRFYVLYFYPEGQRYDLKAAWNILKVVDRPFFEADEKPSPGVYRVSAVDRAGNESQLSEPLVLQ